MQAILHRTNSVKLFMFEAAVVRLFLRKQCGGESFVLMQLCCCTWWRFFLLSRKYRTTVIKFTDGIRCRGFNVKAFKVQKYFFFIVVPD